MNKVLTCFPQKIGFIMSYDTTFEEGAFYDDELLQTFQISPMKAMLKLVGKDISKSNSLALEFLQKISHTYIESIAKTPNIEMTRVPQKNVELTTLLSNLPYFPGSEFINEQWCDELWEEMQTFITEELHVFKGTVEEYLDQYAHDIIVVGRVYFHLVENKDDEYPFAFLATYSSGKTGTSDISQVPLKNALIEFSADKDAMLNLLSAVTRAAEVSTFISNLLESGELLSPLRFTKEEAYELLKQSALLEECGIILRIPKWWRKKTNTLQTTISLGEKAPSYVGRDEILDINVSFMLDGEKLSELEIQSILAESEGLSFLKGKWVEVDREKLKLTLEMYEKAMEKAEHEGISLAQAMSLHNEFSEFDSAQWGTEITHGKWLEEVISKLSSPRKLEDIATPTTFKAQLRAYQQEGLNWLSYMEDIGFGALLADDMGLGKTVQILALLSSLQTRKKCRSLLIIPASLIHNWEAEAHKFAPTIKMSILHGTRDVFDGGASDIDVYVTTYAMAVKIEALQEIVWDVLILDEAQAIKNPGTKQTKAIKSLQAKMRIAMTGTPIENRLLDLWSLFDFINTGLLGTVKEFGVFAKGLAESVDGYGKIRKVVQPFILRRIKTDKQIIKDLPEKMETIRYTSLTKKQVVLYKKQVDEIKDKLENSEGIARKGLILASITKFKQICNHPDQFLGQTEFNPKNSGKFEQLQQICETIYQKRERVLIFTQYREMTEPIAKFLATIFEREGLVLHGGTSIKKRGELVERFCGEQYVPFMVLSLKAGGVGLNLTSANHVIHFDRWWNPAIENQATDRAFRIGQTQDVLVHKFVTTGTIEEKIAEMLENKQNLSNEIVAASGESWITEMSNEELINLMQLGGM